jgi:hypothetical protein
LTLRRPGSRATLEIYGRWLRGTRFTRDPKSTEQPAADLIMVVLEGDVDLRGEGNRFGLHAPPGPATVHWESQSTAAMAVRNLDALPAWSNLKPSATPENAAREKAREALRQRLLAGTAVADALVEMSHAENADQRRLAVFGLGAIDDLPHLLDALADEKNADVRDSAVVALRHWIGRRRGQDMSVYDALLRIKKYPAGQAEVVMQLLHSFDDRDRARPATYEVLIDYLMHDRIAIRQLAHWHLARLASAGRSIVYDAAAPAEQRREAQTRWKELVPDGKLPPSPVR